MLTQKEAAAVLGVTTRTIKRWVRAGIIKQHSFRPRGARIVRYRPEDLAAVLSYTGQMGTRPSGALAN